MKRLQPRRYPYRVRIDTAGETGPPDLKPEDIDLGNEAYYIGRTDEIVLHAGQAVVVISNGRRLAEQLAKGFTSLDERMRDPGAIWGLAGVDPAPCPCGTLVYTITLPDGATAAVEATPHANGTILITDATRLLGRLITPFEEPTGTTYRVHTCKEQP